MIHGFNAIDDVQTASSFAHSLSAFVANAQTLVTFVPILLSCNHQTNFGLFLGLLHSTACLLTPEAVIPSLRLNSSVKRSLDQSSYVSRGCKSVIYYECRLVLLSVK